MVPHLPAKVVDGPVLIPNPPALEPGPVAEANAPTRREVVGPLAVSTRVDTHPVFVLGGYPLAVELDAAHALLRKPAPEGREVLGVLLAMGPGDAAELGLAEAGRRITSAMRDVELMRVPFPCRSIAEVVDPRRRVELVLILAALGRAR